MTYKSKKEAKAALKKYMDAVDKLREESGITQEGWWDDAYDYAHYMVEGKMKSISSLWVD
jgi:hypothetical protein